MKISHTFGTFIKEKRQQRDISLRKFADQIGISPVYLSNLENDRMPAPKDEVVSTMARLLLLNDTDTAMLYITLRWFDAISAVPLPYCLICQQTTVSVLDELNLSVVYQFAEFIDADAAVLTHLLNRFKHGDDLRLMNGLLSSCHSQSSFIYLPRYNRIPAAHCSRCRCP